MRFPFFCTARISAVLPPLSNMSTLASASRRAFATSTCPRDASTKNRGEKKKTPSPLPHPPHRNPCEPKKNERDQRQLNWVPQALYQGNRGNWTIVVFAFFTPQSQTEWSVCPLFLARKRFLLPVFGRKSTPSNSVPLPRL